MTRYNNTMSNNYKTISMLDNVTSYIKENDVTTTFKFTVPSHLKGLGIKDLEMTALEYLVRKLKFVKLNLIVNRLNYVSNKYNVPPCSCSPIVIRIPTDIKQTPYFSFKDLISGKHIVVGITATEDTDPRTVGVEAYTRIEYMRTFVISANQDFDDVQSYEVSNLKRIAKNRTRATGKSLPLPAQFANQIRAEVIPHLNTRWELRNEINNRNLN